MLANVTFCLAVSTNFQGPGGIYKPVVNFAILLTQPDLCKLLEVMIEPRARQGYGIFSPRVCLPKTDSTSLGTILLRSLCFQKHLCLHRHPLINNSVHCTRMGEEKEAFFFYPVLRKRKFFFLLSAQGTTPLNQPFFHPGRGENCKVLFFCPFTPPQMHHAFGQLPADLGDKRLVEHL